MVTNDMSDQSPNFPQTVDEAVTRLILELPLRDRTEIAKMSEEDLGGLHVSLGNCIKNEFDLWGENKQLLESCRSVSGEHNLHVDSAASVIIKELWKTLRETHILRVVK